jgi:hypothetical protein
VTGNNEEPANAPDLEAIRQRCDKATGGPWKSYIEGRDHESGSNFIMTSGEDIELLGATIDDQEFIANARQDIPALLSEVARLVRPGQLTPNALESAILHKISVIHPDANLAASKLHVLSRKYTGVGSFTTFNHATCEAKAPRNVLNLPGVITIAGVPNGLGAHLMLLAGLPDCLEIYTFGSDHWDGTFDSFSLPADV